MKREEIIENLEQLEHMNRVGLNVTTFDVVSALSLNFKVNALAGKQNQKVYAELLEEIKDLVDVKDYIPHPRSFENKAIHIGNRVYKVGGDGEPLIVEEITIRNGGSTIRCRYADISYDNSAESVRKRSARPVFFQRELTFDKPDITVIHWNKIKENISCTITKDGIEWHNN